MSQFRKAPKTGVIAGNDYRLSGPYAHNGLAVYLIHGDGRDNGPEPLTLGEAMAQTLVEVVETGAVQRLVVRNLSDREIFIQSGDIVKGGLQDRVLTASMILQPHSGDIPVDAFCVEAGRWSGSARRFGMAAARLPSKAGRIAMAERNAGDAPGRMGDGAFGLRMASGSSSRQQRIWRSVSKMQDDLVKASGDTGVLNAESPTSLRRSLDHKAVASALEPYRSALGGLAEAHPDAAGYVFAVDGKLNSGDEFGSAGLFRKLWKRQLDAAATEAIAEETRLERGRETSAPPLAEVAAFIDTARNGASGSRDMPGRMTLVSRATDKTLFSETVGANDVWVHRSYVAR